MKCDTQFKCRKRSQHFWFSSFWHNNDAQKNNRNWFIINRIRYILNIIFHCYSWSNEKIYTWEPNKNLIEIDCKFFPLGIYTILFILHTCPLSVVYCIFYDSCLCFLEHFYCSCVLHFHFIEFNFFFAV